MHVNYSASNIWSDVCHPLHVMYQIVSLKMYSTVCRDVKHTLKQEC